MVYSDIKFSTFKAVAHGISRIAIAKAQGQKTSSAFWSGFAASGFSIGTEKYGGVSGRTAIMAVVSGTVSQITGGKFSNGAVTGAFIHLFNTEAKHWQQSINEHNQNALTLGQAQNGNYYRSGDTWKCDDKLMCSVGRGAWEGFGDGEKYGNLADGYLNQYDIYNKTGRVIGVAYGMAKGTYEYYERQSEK